MADRSVLVTGSKGGLGEAVVDVFRTAGRRVSGKFDPRGSR
jgi:NAD(P)-dependent dehydrogenase (short-subunit alcohol dehydrogenase family)